MNLNIQISEYNSTEQLPGKEQDLVLSAIDAANSAYSPYSGFSVGAAILLDNGEIITGSNQENAAYPDGLCAERVALFYANSSFPDVPVKCIAIAAKNLSGMTEEPVTPCGSCRQALIEAEFRFNNPIRIIMTGKNKILSADSVQDLLPLSFNPSFLKGKKL
jgi:cytidine deaminase